MSTQNKMYISDAGIINTNYWQESKITPQIKTFVNTNYPQIIHIIKTGWISPQMYSVIIEDGELGYPYLQFLNAEQIKKKFNIILD